MKSRFTMSALMLLLVGGSAYGVGDDAVGPTLAALYPSVRSTTLFGTDRPHVFYGSPMTQGVNPQDAVIHGDLEDQTRRVLATLAPREERVLKMRFGIGERANHTLEEVGQDFDVTRERIRQIEAKALRKLRHPSRSRLLKSFVES